MASRFHPGRGYELKDEIGAGAYGVVHRAYQAAAGRDVAIKTILPTYADQPDFAARFDAEAQLVARLEHPHIVPIYDTWRDENGAHLVMRLLRGGTLKELLKAAPFTLDEVTKLMEQVTSALDAAHYTGIIHRDIKPSNILFDDRGNAYLSDFGIAKNLATEVTLTPTGAVVGTPDYIAPEQIRGEELTAQADQYSLGLVLFEALTGIHPFKGESIAALFHNHLTEPLPLVSTNRSGIPGEVDTVLQKATAKQPADRYPGIVDFGEAIRLTILTSDRRPVTVDRLPVPGPQPRVPSFLEDSAQPERPVFVGREQELDRLKGLLEKAVQGQGGVAFVAGDAGSGKTALMQAFADLVQEQFIDMLVVKGTCNAFSGSGDPYLPFRGALRMLTGDVESRWSGGTITYDQAVNLWKAIPLATRAVLTHGKALLATFVPGQSLLERVTSAAPNDLILIQDLKRVVAGEIPKPGELEQSELLGQYCQVFQEVAKKRPILLLLDDLHWVDSGSVSLLFQMVRVLAGTRVLVVGSYRPEEISVGRRGERHPLAPVLDELKREHGDVWIDLNIIKGAEFVDKFLDAEPNSLRKEFRQKLINHTGGHALYTVELLRDMQEQGDLIHDEDGSWIEGPDLDWETLPDRVEGVIAARIGRLEEDLREILTVAAVEGEDFTAQVVARVQQMQERRLLRTLSVELTRRHQLVRERSGLRVGDRLLARYRFAHSLFQRYLYNDLGEVERGLLHGEIAAILEELYADSLDEILSQLAMHYSEAGESDKAVKYLLRSGDRAREQYAHQEAIDHYRRALSFLKEQNKTEMAARALMKLGLAYHQALDFENAHLAYEEGFKLWQRSMTDTPSSSLPPAPHALRLQSGIPATLDPAKSTEGDALLLFKNLFSGLARYSADMDLVPDVAREWEIKKGGDEYIIHLRDDVFWTDGEPVTAGDIKFAWIRILDPATDSLAAELLFDIKGAEEYHKGKIIDPAQVGIQAVDDRTFVIKLDRIAAYFPYLFATPNMRPVLRHIVEKYGDAWSLPANIVTNGPFRLQAGQFEEHKTLVRNPSYHGRFSGNLEQVVLRGSSDFLGLELSMYREDDLHAISLFRVSPDKMEPVRQEFAGEYFSRPSNSTGCLFFDFAIPPMDDGRIRQALALASNKEELCIDLYGGLIFPATGGFIPPGIPGHSPGIGLPYDLDRARQLLSEAGHPGGQGLTPIKTLAPHNFARIIEFLADRWRRDIGIDVRCEAVDWHTYNRSSGCYHIYPSILEATYPDPDDFMRNEFLLTSPWENGSYKDLIEEARRNMDHDERMALYHQADRILMEEAAVVPLSYIRWHNLVKPWAQKRWAALLHGQWKDAIIEAH